MRSPGPRGHLAASLVFGAAALVGAQTPVPAPVSGSDATQVLAAAREALGGEKRLSSVTSFVATGRTRQVQGDNLVPIEFEISCELPDKYARRDGVPARESWSQPLPWRPRPAAPAVRRNSTERREPAPPV